MKNTFKLLQEHNFWDRPIANIGLNRDSYLDDLKEYLGNNLIKVLIGQRRAGKSFVLRQLMNFLIKEQNVSAENILYINFEIREFAFYNTEDKLDELIKSYVENINPKGKLYFFFDEIQEVEGWEKVINSYIANLNLHVEIFITGSNSRLLSSDLATYITGRYVVKKIHPLSFKEYLSFNNLTNSKEELLNYLNTSQVPEIINLKDDLRKRNFINALKDSIIMNDIVKRFSVQNVDLIEKIFLFLCDNISKPFSLNSINKKLKEIGLKTNAMTVSNYIRYLEYAFLIQGIDRYDIKGKKILEGEKKYFLNDLGFKKYLTSSFDPALGKLLENYVFKCLDRLDYNIHIGNINGREIDFIAEKPNKKIYIQVAYLITDEEVVKREYGNLEQIHDSWEKIVVTMDDIKLNPKEGIKHIRAIDFEDFLEKSCE